MEFSSLTYNPNRSLWEEQCKTSCPIFDQCGGTSTAPCVCFKKDKERYDCSNCNKICRERNAPPTGIYPNDTFEFQILSGRALDDVFIRQEQSKNSFPLFIPLKTHLLKTSLKRNYIGIQLDQLITTAYKPNIRRYLLHKSETINHFKVKRDTKFIAVLNTKDEFLEALWRMPDRDKLYNVLKKLGIKYITGPTFSINKESFEHPASHNVTMLLRHNKIIQEIYNHGLTPIPNIYWRSDLDIRKWIKWIQTNPIHLIARDFSLISKSSGTPVIIMLFLEMLKKIEKPLHIFFTGVGIVHASYLVEQIKLMGNHTCSIISSSPIINGISGGKKLDAFLLRYRKDLSMNKNDAALFNVRLFESILNKQYKNNEYGQVSLFC